MIKVSIHQNNITILNIYTPNIRGPKYIKHTVTDLKAERESNAKIIGDFNTPL